MFDYKYRMAHLVEHALKLKYPSIKGLIVIPNDDETISIKFEDDGIHSKVDVENFINKFRNNGSKT